MFYNYQKGENVCTPSKTYIAHSYSPFHQHSPFGTHPGPHDYYWFLQTHWRSFASQIHQRQISAYILSNLTHQRYINLHFISNLAHQRNIIIYLILNFPAGAFFFFSNLSAKWYLLWQLKHLKVLPSSSKRFFFPL